jgi:hypothetical protein
LDAAVPVLGIHTAFQPNGTNIQGARIRVLNGGSRIADVVSTATGAIQIIRADGTVVGTTPNNVYIAGAFTVWEVKFDRPNGNVELRINGSPALTVNGANLGAANIDVFDVGCPNGDSFNDDLIVWDTSGTINNDFFGPSKVATIFPDADTGLFDFTKSTGTSGSAILATNPQGVQFIEGTTVGAVAEYNIANISGTAVSVAGAMLTTLARASDVNPARFRQGLNSGGFVQNGSEKILTASNARYFDVIERDPNGNVLWTPAAINAALGRITRTL